MADSGCWCSGRHFAARISTELIRRRTEVQASGIWTPPTGTLGQIVGEARARVAGLRNRQNELERAAAAAGPSDHSFRDVLRSQSVGVIAEVKRKSPSKGWIAEGLTAVDQAHSYA